MPTPVLRPARPFILVRENLKKLGAVPVSEYLAAIRSGTSCINVSRHENEGVVRAACLPGPSPSAAPTNSLAKEESISKLEGAVETTFANYSLADALRFDIARRSGDPNGIQCILTITRPDGAHRIYESRACHSRNHDAKMQVAEIAVEKGAIDFIRHSDVEVQESELPEPVLHGTAMLQPDASEVTTLAVPQDIPMGPDTGLFTEAEGAADGEAEEDANVLEIERACEQWGSTEPRPDWVFYQSNETEATPARWGAAVRIYLTVPQVYSTEMAYGTARAAKAACAALAIEKNVMRDIKNPGATVIAPTSTLKPEPSQKLTTAISLDEWFAALPRPLPEILGTKSPTEMAAPSMLNTLITKARGARFKIDYFFPVVCISDVYALHGCVLRIDRPGECRSYMVDPIFSRRHDARQAASLLAMIQGAGEYIKQIGVEVDEKIPPRLRTLVHDRIFTILGRKGAVDTHVWTFNIDREAYGCTLMVELGSEEHTYVSEPEYRTKADAKCAAALVAAEHGLIELLRFRGKPPPPDYQSFWETFQAAFQEEDGIIANEKAQTRKRKRGDGEPVPTASSGRRKRKRVLKMKLAEEAAAAAAAAALGQDESSESSTEPWKPLTGESDTAGERLGVPSSGSEPRSSAEPQSLVATTQIPLSEKALGKQPSTRTSVEPVAADPFPSQKTLGKRPATDSSTSHISGGVSLGMSTKTKTRPKSKHTASPVPIPQGYERLPPSTPAYPYPQPQPQPPAPPIQRPPPPGYAPLARPPPRPYDLDYGVTYPHSQTHQHLYPPTRPPPTFSAPYPQPQPYPFTGLYPPPPPTQHMFTGPPPGHYPHAYEPRNEPPRRYAYGQRNSPQPPLPAHTSPQGMSQAPPPYMGNHSGGSRWGQTRR